MLTPENEAKIERDIKNLEIDLTSRLERQRQKEKINIRISELGNLLREIKDEERHFKQARLFSIKFQNDKKLKDSEMISRAMKAASELVLRKNSITPEFLTKGGKYPESNIVVKKGDRIVSLEATEGTGVAESVSLLTLQSVLQSTPYSKISLLDEYFSSVSPENSLRISDKLNEMFDGKVQVTMVEQKNEIFEYASYREFEILNDGEQSFVVISDVNYVDGEKIKTPFVSEED